MQQKIWQCSGCEYKINNPLLRLPPQYCPNCDNNSTKNKAWVRAKPDMPKEQP